MIIAIVVPQFTPKWLGGMEMATKNLAEQLSARGHTVHIITFLDEELSPENFEDGYFIHRIKNPLPRIGIIFFWFNVIKTLKKINPDIIHLQGVVVLGTGLPVLFSHFLLNKPYVVYCHGFYLYGKDQSIYQRGFGSRFLFNLIIKYSNAIIVLTEFMKNDFANWPNKKIFIVPNGIAIHSANNFDRDVIRNELSIKTDEHILLFVGRLHAVKGLKYLILAMKTIQSRDKLSRLLIVGKDQGQRKILDDLIKKLHLEENICFIEETSHENVFRYMMASDIFILPSLSEGFPLVLLEAMSCGIPLVASDVGGISEIIQDNRNGFLVQTRNPDDIAEKVLKIVKDDVLIKKISEYNLIDVKKYNWDNITLKLEQIYGNKF